MRFVEPRLSWQKKCRNPYCDDWMSLGRTTQLCPSCRLMGKWGMAVGAVLGGILMRLFG